LPVALWLLSLAAGLPCGFLASDIWPLGLGFQSQWLLGFLAFGLWFMALGFWLWVQEDTGFIWVTKATDVFYITEHASLRQHVPWRPLCGGGGGGLLQVDICTAT
jgi:hypothetical protein